jgi:hypothetical protein
MRTSGDRDRTSSVYWYRRGQELARRPLTRAEILLIEGTNFATRKEHGEAHRVLRDALANAGNDADIQLRILYTRQGILFDQENWSGVIETSRQIMMHRPVGDLWILPHALVREAQAAAKLGRREEALRLLDEAGRYEDYDFQESLEGRMEEEQERLKETK